MDKPKQLFHKYREIIAYIIVGGLTTLTNWVIYSLLILLVRHATGTEEVGAQAITLSNAGAWFGAVLFAFFANKVLVFESKSFEKQVFLKELVLFFGARMLSGVVEIFAPGILVAMGLDQKIFGIEGFAAKILVSVFVVILNYVLGKWMVFRKKK
ncbi:MAG: GtrA family protein [Lachnospiraceae bacterium]|nr:GtrA family protein [Lachnospiraceae bacterium]